MITKITSRDNQVLKTIRSLHHKKGRAQTGLYFAEGVRLVGDAIDFAPARVRLVVVSESYFTNNEFYINSLDNSGKKIYITEDKIFADICDTETPQGIAAVLEIPDEATPDFSSMNYALVLDGVAEPGNMGTIIRTAEAAGINGIFLMKGCVDIYSPKVVRSAMGSVFRMNFFKSDVNTLEVLKAEGFKIAATALYNSMPIEDAVFNGKRAIVIGNEAHGVSGEVLSIADMSVRIDMCGKVESLNAAVAAGIAMYMLRP